MVNRFIGSLDVIIVVIIGCGNLKASVNHN